MDQGKGMEEYVFSCIEKYGMIETGDRVTVGLSGGADSVCLLFLLWEYKKKKDFCLQAVHVNHQIRGDEAKRDQEFALSLCRTLGIPCAIYSYPVEKIACEKHMTVEEAGRIMRQRAFLSEKEKTGAAKVALAHHRDDLVETVLHNLIRGSGVGGMTGIRPVSRLGGITYIRPLIETGKKQITAWLEKKEILWMEDSTNRELAYTRNKIRRQIIPLMEEINGKATEHIARSAHSFLMAEEYLIQQRDMLYSRYVKREDGRLSIDDRLFKEHPVMQMYVVKKAVEDFAGQKKDITSAHLKSVRALKNRKTGSRVSLIRGITAVKSYGEICLFRGKWTDEEKKELEFAVFPYKNQQIPEKKYTKWFDYDKIKGNLSVRSRMPGDYLTVTGAGGKKKLKDYFIDCKIPRQERDYVTLLAEGSHVLWVVGYRISEYYKITDETKTVMEVQVKGENRDE